MASPPSQSPRSDSVARLLNEYLRRKRHNSRYSLRSFARHLGVPSGPLSEILAEKRSLTLKLGRKIAERLAYSEREQSEFLRLVEKELASQARLRRLSPHGELAAYRPLAMDRFALIADWYHFALLALLETEPPREPTPRWLARRLGIEVRQAKEGLARLQRLGLVELRGRQWVPTGNLTTTHDVPSLALRHHHRGNLERALEALDSRTVMERDISSITMAIDPGKLPLAKQAILRFRRELAGLLEEGAKTEVYQLQVLLVPVTKRRKR